jgi:uncharacterized protein YjbI with pentapeptide repeats
MLLLHGPNSVPISELRDVSGRVIMARVDEMETLDDRDLTGAILDAIQADGLICMGAKFDKASLKGADLYWMVAIHASFRNASLEDCTFRGANLSSATFDGALVRRTRFLLDNLGGRTNLSAADLSKAIIEGADFTGASYDADTKFPYGFDPAAAGLIRDNGMPLSWITLIVTTPPRAMVRLEREPDGGARIRARR